MGTILGWSLIYVHCADRKKPATVGLNLTQDNMESSSNFSELLLKPVKMICQFVNDPLTVLYKSPLFMPIINSKWPSVLDLVRRWNILKIIKNVFC